MTHLARCCCFAAPLLLGRVSLAAQVREHDPGHSERLGRVVFPTSCTPEAQRRFERAMAALHSFWWDEGARAFRAVAEADSGCAMAYWGLALNYWGNPFAGGASGESLRQGAAAAARALALGAPTPRERGFLAAAGALYRNVETEPNARRLQAYSDTLARVYGDHPDDPEVAIYYALSLVATASRTDTTFARQKRAAEILNPLFRRFPQHPGLAHYLIHANDSPRLAYLGLDAARRYAQIAPSAPHAQHMPVADGLALTAVLSSDVLLANYNRVAMEARIPLERGDWAAAARLPVRTGAQLNIGAALTRFARGIGAARSGDTAQARAEVADLGAIAAELERRQDPDWTRVVGIKQQAVAAWLALAAGDTAAARREAEAAAEREDVTEKHPVTPAELLPARELEADLLLALGRFAEARRAYEATLAREPRRARSVFGAARAAALAGDGATARARYDEFLKLMERADGDRPELQVARAFVASR